MRDATHIIFEYVLDRSINEPTPRRIELLDALSQLVNPDLQKDLLKITKELSAIDRRHRQLTLSFIAENSFGEN